MHEEYTSEGRIVLMNGRAILEIVVEDSEEAKIIVALVIASLRATTAVRGRYA